MTAFEARQAMRIEPDNATEQSIFDAIDAVIRVAAQNAASNLGIECRDAWMASLLNRYLTANGFEQESHYQLSDDTWWMVWYWAGTDNIGRPDATFDVDAGELTLWDDPTHLVDESGVRSTHWRARAMYAFQADGDGQRQLLPE